MACLDVEWVKDILGNLARTSLKTKSKSVLKVELHSRVLA